jgi:hypothetical protein
MSLNFSVLFSNEKQAPATHAIFHPTFFNRRISGKRLNPEEPYASKKNDFGGIDGSDHQLRENR